MTPGVGPRRRRRGRLRRAGRPDPPGRPARRRRARPHHRHRAGRRPPGEPAGRGQAPRRPPGAPGSWRPARSGRENRFSASTAPLAEAERWLADAGAAWDDRLDRLGRAGASYAPEAPTGDDERAMRRMLKLVAATLVVAVVTPVTAAGVMLAAYLFLPLPANLPERSGHQTAQISRVYDAAGNEIGTFKQFETSIPSAPEDIPEVLKQAVVAAEDRSFYSHGGVDIRGTLRGPGERPPQPGGRAGRLHHHPAAREDHHRQRQGADGPPQDPRGGAGQPARPLDGQGRRSSSSTSRTCTWARAPTARPPPRRPTSASRCRSSPLSEAALLAGLIPAPSRYSPRVSTRSRPSRSGRSSSTRCSTRTPSTSPPTTPPSPRRCGWPPTGRPPARPRSCTRPRPSSRASRTSPTTSASGSRRTSPAGVDQIYQDGLRIETTLDPDQQAAARQQVADFLKGTQPDLRAVARRGRAADRLRAGVHLRRRRLRHRPGQLRARRGERRRGRPAAARAASPGRRSSRSCWPRP